MDTDQVGNLPPSIFTTRARSAFGMTEALPSDDFRVQLAAQHGVDGGVDDFVRNPQ
ncbi:MAG: hypothetical protein ACYCZA_09960 [Thiobacillus sp.]